GVGVGDLPVREQLHLLQLLVDGHLAQQRVDPLLDVAVGRPARGLQRLVVAALRGRHHASSRTQYCDRRCEQAGTAPEPHLGTPPDFLPGCGLPSMIAVGSNSRRAGIEPCGSQREETSMRIRLAVLAAVVLLAHAAPARASVLDGYARDTWA